jgi:hypothetical protein
MHAELKEIAAEEDRALNAQIVRFLREALEQHRAQQPKREQADRSE